MLGVCGERKDAAKGQRNAGEDMLEKRMLEKKYRGMRSEERNVGGEGFFLSRDRWSIKPSKRRLDPHWEQDLGKELGLWCPVYHISRTTVMEKHASAMLKAELGHGLA